MKRMSRHLCAGLGALALWGAGAASAQTRTEPPATDVRPPEPPSPSSSEPRGPDGRARMHSSHTVDVIAPGEKVDTILGRMRPERPQPPPRGDAVRPPPGSDARGGGAAPSDTGRAQQARPLDSGRDGPREPGRHAPSPRGDGPAPPSSSRPPPR